MKPQWSQERQSNPPHFGEAELVSENTLHQIVHKRQKRCQQTLERYAIDPSYEPGLISIVILSCKRLEALQRLCDSLIPYLKTIEDYSFIEVTLVDNASGPELIDYAKGLQFFDHIIEFQKNHGMLGALRRVFPEVRGEYILFLEDDFVLEAKQPFLKHCLSVFEEFPEIGIIRLKNQNNWWKPHRRIAPLRSTSDGTAFWTWLPSKARTPWNSGKLNGWCAGSVLFRKVSYLSVGDLPDGENIKRHHAMHQGSLYEEVYGKRYNKQWLAAKLENCYPFFQPNDEEESPGWGEE